ncbi:MAG: GHKL domain-containing protein [Lachnospiraceae bacterium]|nr:GHKL domain-containing protein [Lachnospiraceae bacterium]
MKSEYVASWFLNSFQMQILLIVLVYCWNLPRRRYFPARLLILGGLYLFLPYLVPESYFMPALLIGGWLPLSFPLMTVLSAVLLVALFQITAKQCAFYVCLAHTLQHLIHCCSRVFWLIGGFLVWQISEVCFLLAVLLLSGLFLRKKFGDSETAEMKSLWLLGFAIISSLSVYFISYWTSNFEVETLGYNLYDVGFSLLQIMILLEVFQSSKTERDHTIMLHLLKQEQTQSRDMRITADTINRKCHDLKHQISALRSMPALAREKSISELEKAVMLYDNYVKTGNEDLDIILAEKNMIAMQSGIQILCMADGKQLNFLKPEDLYSLLGNALDNAIEATGQEPDAERRIVRLQITRKNSFVSIHVDNPCPVAPSFSDGLPETTKEDTSYHGFGMRSMRYIAEQYGGALTARWKDGFFSLNVVFPQG